MTILEPTIVHTGLDFGEGPRWHDGVLWFSDFYRHGVFTLDGDGTETRVVTVDHQPSGLGWMPDGTLLISSMLDRKLLAFDDDGLREHADLSAVVSSKCNDIVVATDGTAYVGHFGFDLDLGAPFAPASLIRVTPAGEVHVAVEDLSFPNGAVITPDGATLIVGETFGGRYSAFDIDTDGSLHNRRVWASVDGSMPDGCCLDAEGAIWMADVTNNRFCRVCEGGEITDTIAVDGNAVACMLGGDDRRTLYLFISPTTVPAQLEGRGRSTIATTRVAVAGAGRP